MDCQSFSLAKGREALIALPETNSAKEILISCIACKAIPEDRIRVITEIISLCYHDEEIDRILAENKQFLYDLLV